MPKDVACPGAARSIRRTGMPLSCSDRAQQIPTMPAPIMVTCSFIFMPDALLHARNCVMSIGDVMTDLKESHYSSLNLLARWDPITVLSFLLVSSSLIGSVSSLLIGIVSRVVRQ